jgi:hypothetical protein
MRPRMQRFSPDIQWVLVGAKGGGAFDLYCEVCGGGGTNQSAGAATAFAQAHRVHQAPQGSLRLGDAFAAIAKPVARAVGIDPNCTPCEARRRAMNRW